MDAMRQFTTADTADKSGSPMPVTPRVEDAWRLERAQQCGFWWQSLRQVAQTLGVPDSSFRYCWQQYRRRCQSSRLPRPLVEFCESPAGLAFLQQQLIALHLVFVQANDCGLRNLTLFLQLSGLDEVLASSYGAQQAFAARLETLLAEYGREEEQRLAAQMPPRQITACEDETFHPHICLVAMEPVSGYLLLEQYAPQRDAETWNRCLDERLVGWSITVCQATSDEAKALIAHAEEHLGAHHSPDLFHVQQETVKATSLALAGQTRRAQEAFVAAEHDMQTWQADLTACQQQCPQSTHVAELQQQVATASAAEAEARQRLTACQQRQRDATAARHGISRDYHPIDIATGRPVTDEEVGRRLTEDFDWLDKVARDAGLSAHAREKLAKARRVLPAMVSTITFFWTTVVAWLAKWSWPWSAERTAIVTTWLRADLLPGLYLERAAAKASTAQERQRLRTLAQEVLARARSPDGVWGTLTEPERVLVETRARECADLFQRSSSCVEGRNGQLSLRHHGLHRLTPRKLGALRVLHNFLIERADKTTAAERFFGARPRPLLPWLVVRLPLPARPRRHAVAA